MRAGCRCKYYGVCMSVFFCHAPRPGRCSFEVVYFEQGICVAVYGLNLMPLSAVFSKGIALSDELDNSHFCC